MFRYLIGARLIQENNLLLYRLGTTDLLIFCGITRRSLAKPKACGSVHWGRGGAATVCRQGPGTWLAHLEMCWVSPIAYQMWTLPSHTLATRWLRKACTNTDKYRPKALASRVATLANTGGRSTSPQTSAHLPRDSLPLGAWLTGEILIPAGHGRGVTGTLNGYVENCSLVPRPTRPVDTSSLQRCVNMNLGA